MAAVQKCDVNSLNQLGKCYQCLSQLENEAAVVYWLNQRFAKLNGTPAASANTLRTLAAPLRVTFIDPIADNLQAATAQQGAIAAGVAGASTITIAQIRSAMLQFSNMSITDLKAIECILRCQLNQFP